MSRIVLYIFLLIVSSMAVSCKDDAHSSLQGFWAQKWHNPFLGEHNGEVWKLNFTEDSVTIKILDSLGGAVADSPESFKVSVGANAITLYTEQGDSASMAYYVNNRYDTMSLKFFDHSSRTFIRTSAWK